MISPREQRNRDRKADSLLDELERGGGPATDEAIDGANWADLAEWAGENVPSAKTIARMKELARERRELRKRPKIDPDDGMSDEETMEALFQQRAQWNHRL